MDNKSSKQNSTEASVPNNDKFSLFGNLRFERQRRSAAGRPTRRLLRRRLP
jgi:hypothetical protein